MGCGRARRVRMLPQLRSAPTNPTLTDAHGGRVLRRRASMAWGQVFLIKSSSVCLKAGSENTADLPVYLGSDPQNCSSSFLFDPRPPCRRNARRRVDPMGAQRSERLRGRPPLVMLRSHTGTSLDARRRHRRRRRLRPLCYRHRRALSHRRGVHYRRTSWCSRPWWVHRSSRSASSPAATAHSSATRQ